MLLGERCCRTKPHCENSTPTLNLLYFLLHHEHSSIMALHSVSDSSRNDWQAESLLVRPSVFMGALGSVYFLWFWSLCVCWENDGPSSSVFVSVCKDAWGSVWGGAAPTGCHVLRLTAPIICWPWRRIYPLFVPSMKTFLSICVCFGRRVFN